MEKALQNIKKIVLSKNIKIIKDKEFYSYTLLEEIVIPKSVTKIGNCAFSKCKKLKKVVFEENSQLTSIGACAFSNCVELKEITIPNSVTNIGGWAFFGCMSLEKIILSNNISNISSSAFDNCFHLQYNVEDDNNLINDIEYLGSSENKYLYLANIDTSFCDVAKIDSKCKLINIRALNGCDFLKRIEVSDDNSNYKTIDGVLYSKDMKTLLKYPKAKRNKTFTIPHSVTKIGDSAFSECKTLKRVIFEENSQLTSIGTCAFSNCVQLKGITIPDSVIDIDGWAFEGCISLEKIFIPKTVKKIFFESFSYCPKLTIYCELESNSDDSLYIDLESSGRPVVWGYK